ncbi:hypothetical protein DFP72DRAFT_883300 [Ephemerocybe angulata]|uniref:Uncharacterized protein n=1 Tax=Ephemerocybe angulata TaxID=980116 RepID=A0A8H6MCJ2_9AGAR|nr:hypothetical protein DFP72DRAFT_883300 [Tulosesus angulatus]
MDKTKSRLAQFFDNDEEEPSFPQKNLDDAKLSQYTSGRIRKSRREKEAEAAEAKRREEEEIAARVYAEYIETFDKKESSSSRRGGAGFVRADTRAVYNPLAQSSQAQAPSSSVFQRSPSPPSAAQKPKGKRAMDSFLEELKREQAEREAKFGGRGHGRSVTAMAAYEGQSGSKDRGDPQTTNLFVANLPPHVTENSMGNFFARVGPVGSVKIMWPRGDGTAGPGADMTQSRRTKSSGLSGFVSYMNRHDAEEALREYDGFDWGGCILRVGWSKAVPIAAKALYQSTGVRGHNSASRSRSRSPERDGRRSLSRDGRPSNPFSRSRSIERDFGRNVRHYDSSRSRSPRRRSQSPPRKVLDDDDITDTFIRAVAAEVKGHGIAYEKMLKEREKNNSKYGFMLQRDHRRHAFYRGLIETETSDQAEFDDEGYNSAYSTDSGEESERERTRKNALGRLARKRFEAMLRGLSGKCGEMARCMAFSLEHAEAAHEVADIIVSSLLVDGTPVPRKVARLHLICDILHNSAATVPSAWKFRQEFQGRLGIVFDHLANIYHSFPGRITADLFKKQITTVVDIWEDWIVFPPDFTAQLRQRLEGNVTPEETPQSSANVAAKDENQPLPSSKFKTSSFQPATKPVEPAPVVNDDDDDDGEPMDVSSDEDRDDVDGKPADDIDVDGIPVEDVDVDGEPVDDLDGAPVDEEDVDGEPLREEDLDGEPVGDDDVDGLPVDDLDGEPVA